MKRPGSNRQTEHRILAGPLRRSIAETHDANPPRQSSFDGGLHEIGREESERDRHIDLSNAASLPRSDLLDTGDGAGNNLINRDSPDDSRTGVNIRAFQALQQD